MKSSQEPRVEQQARTTSGPESWRRNSHWEALASPSGAPRGHSGQRAGAGPEDPPSSFLLSLPPSPASSSLLSLPPFPSPPPNLPPFLFSAPLPFFPPFPSLLHPFLPDPFLTSTPPLFNFSSSCQILNSGQKVSSKPLFFPEFAKSSQALSLFPGSLPVIRPSLSWHVMPTWKGILLEA